MPGIEYFKTTKSAIYVSVASPKQGNKSEVSYR